MIELPPPAIQSKDQLLARFAGGMPEQLTLRDFIHTVMPGVTGGSGTGNTDDTDAIQSSLDNFVYTRLQEGATYRITRALTITRSNRHIIGNNATIYMPAASFNNTTDSYMASNAVGLLIKGQLSSPYAQIQNISVRDLTMESEVADGRKVDAIAVQNVKKLRIQGCEIFGFPLAKGLRLNSVTTGWIVGNHIHDFYDNRNTWSGTINMNAMEIDGDRTNAVWSTGLKIDNNRIEQMNVGPAFEAAHAYQSDGINGGQGTTATINNNYITGVGEAIDWYGDYGIISNNVIRDCHYFGIALKHGASFGTISGNVLTDVGLSHIYVGPDAVKGATGNVITGNMCYQITTTGGERCCLKLDIDVSGFKVTGTLVAGNTFFPNGGDHAVQVRGTGTLNCLINNLETPGGTGTYLDAGGAVAAHVPARTDNGWLLSGADPGLQLTMLGIQNKSITASTAVALDLNPSTEEANSRSAQVVARNNGANVITMALRTSDGAVPADRVLIGTGVQIGLPTGGDKGAGNINVQESLWLSGTRVLSGSGSPNGAVTANPGALYLNTAGGAGTSIYVKESGTGTATGWVGK